MIEPTPQTLKVEQTGTDTDMGQVVRFPNQSERHLLKPSLAIAAATAKGTSPNKGHAATGRTREHLTSQEVDALLGRAKQFGQVQHRHRNYTLILMLYRHGLRASEAADLRWTDINLEDGTILVRRLKGSEDSTHYLEGDELRALRKLQRESKPSPYVFGAIASTAISTTVKRIGAGLFNFPIHCHMLRHSCGYYLANQGTDLRVIQQYLGHKSVENTVRYTKLSPQKFKGLWK